MVQKKVGLKSSDFTSLKRIHSKREDDLISCGVMCLTKLTSLDIFNELLLLDTDCRYPAESLKLYLSRDLTNI